MAIKDILRQEMERRGWNAYDLADASGVTQPTINRILNEKVSDPRGNTVKKLAAGLRLTEWQLRGIQPLAASSTVNTLLPNGILESGENYQAPLSSRKRTMNALMDGLTEAQQDELIRLAEERAAQNREVINQLGRPSRKHHAL